MPTMVHVGGEANKEQKERLNRSIPLLIVGLPNLTSETEFYERGGARVGRGGRMGRLGRAGLPVIPL